MLTEEIATPQAAPAADPVAAAATPPAPGGPASPEAAGSASEAATPKPQSEAAKAGYALRMERKARRELEERLTKLEREKDEAIAAKEREKSEIAAERDRIKADPLTEAEKFGANAEDLIRKYVADGAPEKAITAIRDEIAKMKADAEARDKAAAKQRDEDAKQRETSAMQAQVKLFADDASNVEKYPYMNAEFSRVEIEAAIAEGQRWAREGKLRPESRSKEAFLAMLETNAKRVHTHRQGLREKFLASKEAPVPAPESRNGQSKNRKTAAEKPAVAARQEAPKAKLTRTRNNWDPKEIEADLAALRAATEKDKASHTRPNGKLATQRS